MNYLLDTNVISELRKEAKADTNVTAWARRTQAYSQFISAIVLHELELGVLLMERKDAAQGRRLRAWLANQVLPAFEDRVLPVDSAVAQVSARLHVPDPRPIRDAFIAATALVHNMSLVTRDTDDFADTGVTLINPWT